MGVQIKRSPLRWLDALRAAGASQLRTTPIGQAMCHQSLVHSLRRSSNRTPTATGGRAESTRVFKIHNSKSTASWRPPHRQRWRAWEATRQPPFHQVFHPLATSETPTPRLLVPSHKRLVPVLFPSATMSVAIAGHTIDTPGTEGVGSFFRREDFAPIDTS
jgi:hypothetical protein